MDKNSLLKAIAETGYNVGFGGRKHYATYDIVEKAPGLIGFSSTAVGIMGLVIESLSDKLLSATLLVLGVIGSYIYLYDSTKMQYEKSGREITQIFNKLRDLYRTVKDSNSSDMTEFERQLKILEDEYYKISISKQILFSDWYAHYKFFWQYQIDWVDEQKDFRFFRDKVPLSFMFFVIVSIIIVTLVIARKT